MAFIDSDGLQLWVESLDSPVPWNTLRPDDVIVFCHGVGINADIWRGWLPELMDSHRIVRFDTRGFGRSGSPKSTHSDWQFDSYVEDIGRVIKHSRSAAVHLVGESLGGSASLAFACRYPQQVKSLTLVSTGFRGAALNRVGSWREYIQQHGMASWSEQMMAARFVDEELDGPRWEWFHRVQAGTDRESLLTAADLLTGVDLSAELSRAVMPVLLLSPDQSPFIPLQHTIELRDALPNAQLQVFPGCRHGIAFSRDTECAQALAEFVHAAPLSSVAD